MNYFQLFSIVFLSLFSGFYCDILAVSIDKKINYCCSLDYKQGDVLFLNYIGNGNTLIVGVLENGNLQTPDFVEFSKLHNNYDIKISGEKLCIYKEKAEITDNISFLCKKRKGNYGKVTGTKSMNIQVFDPVEFLTKISIINGTIGQDIEVDCNAKGSPGLKVIWIKLGVGQISSGTNSAKLKIPKTTMDMITDKYICEASINVTSDEFKSVIRQTATLNLLHKPLLEIEKSIIPTAVGVTEIINMTVKSNPLGTIFCKSHTQYEATVKMTISTPVKNQYIYQMIIKNVTQTNAGSYWCTATNSIGSVTKQISLMLEPRKLEIISPNDTKYSNYYLLKWTIRSRSQITKVNITYETLSAGAENVQTFMMEGTSVYRNVDKSAVNADNWQTTFYYHLTNLTSNTKYQVFVNACNNHKCINADTTAIFTTRPYDKGNNLVDLSTIFSNGNNSKRLMATAITVMISSMISPLFLMWNGKPNLL